MTDLKKLTRFNKYKFIHSGSEQTRRVSKELEKQKKIIREEAKKLIDQKQAIIAEMFGKPIIEVPQEQILEISINRDVRPVHGFDGNVEELVPGQTRVNLRLLDNGPTISLFARLRVNYGIEFIELIVESINRVQTDNGAELQIEGAINETSSS